MPTSPSHWLVETEWLASHLSAPDVIVLDGSMHLPTSGRNGRAEYQVEHIPGALFFDVDEIADKSNPLPHTLPSTVQFASQMKKMGIGDGSRIIVYDSEGLYSAARVWWMFRTMGHNGCGCSQRRPEEMARRKSRALEDHAAARLRTATPLHAPLPRRSRPRLAGCQRPHRRCNHADHRRPCRAALCRQRARAPCRPPRRAYSLIQKRAVPIAAQHRTAH